MTEAEQAKLRIESARGLRARQIYEDALFRNAVEAIKDRVWADFKSAKPDDAEALRICNLRINLLDEMCAAFKRHMETGKLAKKMLDRIYDAMKPKRAA